MAKKKGAKKSCAWHCLGGIIAKTFATFLIVAGIVNQQQLIWQWGSVVLYFVGLALWKIGQTLSECSKN